MLMVFCRAVQLGVVFKAEFYVYMCCLYDYSFALYVELTKILSDTSPFSR